MEVNSGKGSASSCSKITLRRHNDKNHRRCVEVGENEAKSLLRKLLGSKAAVSVLGAGAQSPRREVFHGIERYIDFKVALDQGPIGRVCETCEIVRSSDKKNRKKLPCLLKSTPTPSAGNRFTATGGSNIPNGSRKWRILHAPHGTARHFHANGIQRVCSCYLSRPRTGNWKVKTYGTCFNASCLLLVLSGDHLLRRLAYRSYAR